jgi:hypothetical protein
LTFLRIFRAPQERQANLGENWLKTRIILFLANLETPEVRPLDRQISDVFINLIVQFYDLQAMQAHVCFLQITTLENLIFSRAEW